MAELRWGAATDSGLVRDANEDSYVAEPLVFGVADGMGGHRAGEVASALASKAFRDRLSAGAPNVDVVIAAVLEANAAIFQAAHANAAQQGMGTTITALAVMAATDDEPEQLALVNVGDSRTYLLRDGELTRATVDHSYVQELVATGHITEAEARTHPRRNIVTRALGIEPTVRVDAWVLPVVRGDRFILCSDGLVDEVPDHEIADVAIGIEEPQRAADELVAMANRHGGRDNTTVIVVDVLDGADPSSPTELDATVVAAVVDADDDTADADATLVADTPSDDDTSEMDVALIEEMPPPRPKRRLTGKLFLLLLGIAAVLTVVITLIAVALTSDDDEPTPTTTTTEPLGPTTSTDSPTTTDAPESTVPRTSPPSTSTPATSAP